MISPKMFIEQQKPSKSQIVNTKTAMKIFINSQDWVNFTVLQRLGL